MFKIHLDKLSHLFALLQSIKWPQHTGRASEDDAGKALSRHGKGGPSPFLLATILAATTHGMYFHRSHWLAGAHHHCGSARLGVSKVSRAGRQNLVANWWRVSSLRAEFQGQRRRWHRRPRRLVKHVLLTKLGKPELYNI